MKSDNNSNNNNNNSKDIPFYSQTANISNYSDNNNNNNNNNININDQNFNVQSMGMANMGRKASFHPMENIKCSIGKFGIEAASSRNSDTNILSNIIR